VVQDRKGGGSDRVKLTQDLVKELQATETKYHVRDSEVVGLVVQVQPNGSKVFKVRRQKGVRLDKTLGRTTELTLTQARRLASKYLGDLAVNATPLAAGDKGPTFAESMEAYFRSRRFTERSSSTQEQYEYYLRKILEPLLAGRRIREITVPDLHRAFDDARSQHGPTAARMTKVVASQVFTHAVHIGDATSNPVKGTESVPKSGEKERAPTLQELTWLWDAFETSRHSADIQDVVRILILTAVRRSEVAGMTWSEIDLETQLWVIPKHRTKKKKKPYYVPLSGEAVAILKRRKEACEHPPGADQRVFNVRPDGVTQSIRKATSKKPFSQVVSPHDFRRTITDTLASRRISSSLLQRVLNHDPNTMLALRHYDHYSYLDEKREVLELWCSIILQSRLQLAEAA
jgi:integrase